MTSDGKSMKEQHDLTSEGHHPGKGQFGNYDLIQRIDMGGMGEVYLAHQRTAFHREVAVKIIRDDLSLDPVARARFFREAEVSAHLKHDHILPLFEFGEVQGRQVVSPSDVENLSSQLRQSLISELSAEMDSQLQALHVTEIGSKQFTDLSESSNPAIGTVSRTVTVTLTEQESVEYINGVDVQQLAHLLLAQELGPNTILVNSTVQIGQPVVEAGTDLGAVTMKVPAAGVGEYQYPSTQLQAILNHIKGMTLANARTYLRQQPGVDANSVSISIHTLFGESNTLPDSASQIKIIPTNPTSVPTASLPA